MRWALLLVVCGACSGGASQSDAAGIDGECIPPPDTPATRGSSVELGTGTVDFSPLVDGDTLGLVTGPQGGFHFIVHARIREMDPGNYMEPGLETNPATTFRAYTLDDRQFDKCYPPYRLGYMPTDPEGTFALPSGRILQIQNEEVPAIYGTRVRIQVRVEDSSGRMAEDSREVMVVPYDDPDGLPDAPDALPDGG